MSLTKVVNGKTFDLTPEEETKTRAEWAANDENYLDRVIRGIKKEAQKRIYAIVPLWKQNNLTARAVELMKKVIDGGTLTQAERDEFAQGLAVWETVKAIRTASDQIEQAAQASESPKSFDFRNSPLWP